MTDPQLVTTTSETLLEGTVVYRCAACGHLIEDEEVYMFTDDDARTYAYHADHIPPLED